MIRPDGPVLFVAEIGGNARGDVDLAVRMVEAAAAAGAEAVKFQTITPGTLVRRGHPLEAEFAAWAFPPAGWRRLRDAAARLGVALLSTPFDERSVEVLEGLDVPAYKIASPDVVHHPLLARVGRTGKPVLLSTGASTLDEIGGALTVLRSNGAGPIVLLQCTVAYPCPAAEADLRGIADLRERFGLPVGLSDHTLGPEVALGAIALGAVVVEKHFTIDRSLPGGDNAISILPEELRGLVEAARNVEAALRAPGKRVAPAEAAARVSARRSIVAARDLAAGAVLVAADLAYKRPADGLLPSEAHRLVGRRLRRPLRADETIRPDDVE